MNGLIRIRIQQQEFTVGGVAIDALKCLEIECLHDSFSDVYFRFSESRFRRWRTMYYFKKNTHTGCSVLRIDVPFHSLCDDVKVIARSLHFEARIMRAS